MDAVAPWLEDAARIPLLLWAYDLQRTILNADADRDYLSRLQLKIESTLCQSQAALSAVAPKTVLDITADAIRYVVNQGGAFSDAQASELYTSLTELAPIVSQPFVATI